MIGRWLDLLTTEEEDRLLTQRIGFSYFSTPDAHDVGCLIQVACARADFGDEPRARALAWTCFLFGMGTVWGRYDLLRIRFEWDDSRVNALIRNRILRNRARRCLTQSPVLVGSTPEGETPAHD